MSQTRYRCIEVNSGQQVFTRLCNISGDVSGKMVCNVVGAVGSLSMWDKYCNDMIPSAEKVKGIMKTLLTSSNFSLQLKKLWS